MFKNGNQIWVKLFGMLQTLVSILVLTPLHPQEGKSVSFADLFSQVFNFKSPCGVVEHRMAISDFCDL